MNVVQRIIKALRPLQKPEPQESEPLSAHRTHTYRVDGDELIPTAQSLDEFYQIQDLKYQAQEVFHTMQYAGELATEDNSPLDSDSRSGHVRLEEHGFESHPDTGFRLEKGEIQVEGNEEQVHSTKISDNWMAKDQSANWDKKDQTFTLSFREEPEIAMPGSPRNLIQEETLPANQDNRASELIKAARYWESQAESLDNTAADLDAASGSVVAPGFSPEQTGSEPVMAETFYVDQNARKDFDVFDLEHGAGKTIVAGNRANGGRPFGAILTAHRTPDSMEVVLERPEIGTTEKVDWVISDGVLHYEKYKKG